VTTITVSTWYLILHVFVHTSSIHYLVVTQLTQLINLSVAGTIKCISTGGRYEYHMLLCIHMID